MPLPTEAQREEKLIARQAVADEKTLKHVIQDVAHAEKSEAKHAKAVDKATYLHGKAISREHKMAGKLAKAEHAHDVSVRNVEDAEKTIQHRQRQHAEMSNELEKAKINMETFKQKKDANDQIREQRLAQLHTDAAADISRRSTLSTNAPPQ